ncbi:MAG: methionine ABC transporter ATP-binding protein [Oscillospiraceae bacterium]|jgi:D-methionine transport system ATP-binding protein
MVEVRNLCKTFKTDKTTVDALKDISLTVNDGEIFGIIGMSGAGKSTLVRCINMMERPDSGQVIIDGKDMGLLSERELREERHRISMVFQHINLLMQRNCLDNVCFPMELVKTPKKEAEKKAMSLLELVGVADKAQSYPAQLSGGQQQRVAIARALASDPKLLLCDEATSALDPKTTFSILELIKDINRRLGITVIVITHQMSVVQEICDRVAILDDGVIVEEGDVGTVFSSPKSQAARKLVFPSGEDDLVSDPAKQRRIRVVFSGSDVAGQPLIARMAIEKGIMANILQGSIRNAGGKTYGTLLLGIPEENGQPEKAIEFLTSNPGLAVEEVKRDE